MLLEEEEVGFESDDKLPLNCPFVKVMRASKSIAENFLPNPLFLKDEPCGTYRKLANTTRGSINNQ